MTPVMNAQLHTVQIACVLRVSLAPVLDDLPFVGAVGLSILDQPYLDFDLRHARRLHLDAGVARHPSIHMVSFSSSFISSSSLHGCTSLPVKRIRHIPMHARSARQGR